ncbi:MAG: glycoside hydrolase [Candidatus Omnitrophica bacterium]|nr:glycoside hydrolase [Candidatus Omnitrophota bacterium]
MSHPVYLAFVWHMHQPYYRDLRTGECFMPWVRLHAAKDYVDMVTRLEAFPTLHQTFNLVPSLVDQLQAYLPPHNLSDSFLDLSSKPAGELTQPEKRFVLENFFLAAWDRMIVPQARYHELLMKRGAAVPEEAWPAAIRRFQTQDYLDLQVWFNLAWIDPWLRSQDRALAALERKGRGFTEADKRAVLQAHLRLVGEVLPTYQHAAQRGQIELTCSPYYHPILPLLCDLQSARESLPHVPLPARPFRHPEDARTQLQLALARHTEIFGKPPAGLWPSEGSVSEEMLRLALAAKLRWMATDEDILWKSLQHPRAPSLLYRPHQLTRDGQSLSMIFRDRELSDLIGFTYSQWEPAAAVKDFMARCAAIQEQFNGAPHPALVSIILDGENAWEYYPGDGHQFFQQLYTALAADDRFRVVTVSEYLDQHPACTEPPLARLHAGSWIGGNFSTWIGQPEKNDGWERLASVRADLLAHDPPSDGQLRGRNEPAWKSFWAAEGSDWWWWYGDTNSSVQDMEFDRLFRAHLANVYQFLQQPVPAALSVPIKVKAEAALPWPTAAIAPTLDGLETTYYEWLYAGSLDLRKGSAMQRAGQLLRMLWYGFDATHCYVRLDFDRARLDPNAAWSVAVDFPDRQATVRISRAPSGTTRAELLTPAGPTPISCGWQRILEVAIPRQPAGLDAGQSARMRLALFNEQTAVEQHPMNGTWLLRIPSDEAAAVWSA